MFKTSDMKRSSVQKYSRLLLPAVIVMICSLPTGAFAAGPPVPSEMSKPVAQVFVLIILALALMIALLANVVNGAAQLYIQKYRDSRKSNELGNATKIITVLLFCLFSSGLFAADAPVAASASADAGVGGLSSTSFYVLISVIGVELIILLALLYNLKFLLAKETAAAKVVAGIEPVAKKSFNWSKWWWEKVNSLRPENEESNIDLGHDYDGIRELDNRLPPWWLYGFYLCIIFAAVYLYRFHVSHSAPSSSQELQIAMTVADAEKEEYLKHAANKVDENTVTYLSDAGSLNEGKKIFSTICAACHMADGGGSVGPNLTDDYYLHGGNIKDLFKTIKYGWPEKGMKSWKDDYSAVQIAQLASYVKSLHGSKPSKPKEPQGTIYEEKTATPAGVADSSKPAAAEKKAAANPIP
jgi:cytochrome c oxidase cbb3-type subunit 3